MFSLYRELPSHSLFPKGCVLTIGNFDGIHIGHQALLNKVIEQGRKLDLPTVLLTFDPTPADYFGLSKPRVLSLRTKLGLLEQVGIQNVFLLRFNEAFSIVTAEDFLDQILLKKLNVKRLVVGDDFRFGYKRSGEIHLLKSREKNHSFQVIEISGLLDNETRITSGLLRTLLQQGNFNQVASYLKRPYMIKCACLSLPKEMEALKLYVAKVVLTRQPFILQGTYQVEILDGCQQYRGVVDVGQLGSTSTEAIIYSYAPIKPGRSILDLVFKHKIRQDERLIFGQGRHGSLKDDLEQQAFID